MFRVLGMYNFGLWFKIANPFYEFGFISISVLFISVGNSKQNKIGNYTKWVKLNLNSIFE